MKRRVKYYKIRKGPFLLYIFENCKRVKKILKRYNVYLDEQMYEDLMKSPRIKRLSFNGKSITISFKREKKFLGGSISLRKVVIEDKTYYKLNYFTITKRMNYRVNDKNMRNCYLTHGL